MKGTTKGTLQGKRVVVTGGGRGIGAAIARLLASEGAMVVVSARSQDEIEEVARELLDQGRQAGAIPCDVTDPEQVDRLVHEAADFLGGVDILINNAGAATSSPIAATTLEDWNRMIAVNATSTFLCSKGFLPPMVERRWGRIVNIASVAGKAGMPYIGAYTAAKHAVIGLTRALAAEVADKGVTVNAVCPGYTDTALVDASISRITNKTRLSEVEARATLQKMSPQKRIFDVEEVAYQVLMLCDPRARGVNGQALVLDGGALQS